MNYRSWIIGAVILLAGVAAWWLLSQRPVLPPQPLTPTATATNNTPTPSSPTASTPATPPPVIPHKPDLPPGQNKEDSMSKVLSTLNDQPIVFYGKLIDQYNNPVSDATVTGSVLISTRFMDQRKEDHTTTTDSNGLFQFEGLHGMSIGIWFKKEGYEFTSNNTSFTYSAVYQDKERHHPDANAPVVFKIWKLQGPQQLVKIGANAYLPCDGSPFSFDLITHRRVNDGGDVTVSIIRNPVNLQGAKQFDWKAVLQINNGGVVAQNDQYPNEAPADGYQSQLVIDMPKSATPWSADFHRTYYLKMRGGQYGRVTLGIYAAFDQPKVPFNFDGYANPAIGSRILEQAAPLGKGQQP
jgi:hypothetical protein